MRVRAGREMERPRDVKAGRRNAGTGRKSTECVAGSTQCLKEQPPDPQAMIQIALQSLGGRFWQARVASDNAGSAVGSRPALPGRQASYRLAAWVSFSSLCMM